MINSNEIKDILNEKIHDTDIIKYAITTNTKISERSRLEIIKFVDSIEEAKKLILEKLDN